MKKGLVFLLFLTLSLTAFAQQAEVVTNETELIEMTKASKVETKNANASSEAAARVLKLNRKKSDDIISIKAFRKSLQIKVKTIKLC